RLWSSSPMTRTSPQYRMTCASWPMGDLLAGSLLPPAPRSLPASSNWGGDGMWSFARSAVLAYRGSFIGSFLVVMFAAALLSANGLLMATGARSDAPMLSTVAASFAGTAILVVVLVVASTFAAALRPRHEQFALLRAVGATASQVRSMVTAEVSIVFAIAG